MITKRKAKRLELKQRIKLAYKQEINQPGAMPTAIIDSLSEKYNLSGMTIRNYINGK